jgi:hypothetical protein
MAKYLKNLNGDISEESSVLTSAGASSAGFIPQLDATGRLDVSTMPSGVGADSILGVTAGEALAAGDMVYLSSTGTAFRADANALAKAAQGFVTVATAVSATVTVYLSDTNSAVTGLTPGQFYFISAVTPGKLVPNTGLPAGTGKFIQRVGFAASATTLHVNIANPVVLA